jgi:hypothetical protein
VTLIAWRKLACGSIKSSTPFSDIRPHVKPKFLCVRELTSVSRYGPTNTHMLLVVMHCSLTTASITRLLLPGTLCSCRV